MKSSMTLIRDNRCRERKRGERERMKRSVVITQEMCPIRTEISTHKHLGKCIYLLFVYLVVISFRQNYFYIYCLILEILFSENYINRKLSDISMKFA